MCFTSFDFGQKWLSSLVKIPKIWYSDEDTKIKGDNYGNPNDYHVCGYGRIDFLHEPHEKETSAKTDGELEQTSKRLLSNHDWWLVRNSRWSRYRQTYGCFGCWWRLFDVWIDSYQDCFASSRSRSIWSISYWRIGRKNQRKSSDSFFYKSVLQISLRQNEEVTLTIDSPGKTKPNNRNRAIEKAIKKFCKYI